ncbi:MAG: hypothetical protein A2293_13115 [Elusimicrobia bacterium RIFOXYB2_FULL_49_7]|nr:MAG: hypothetical protein A2293_13115 [Elusimicrobia bacterium RIFOXYB2_FULL_49_7]
MNSIHHLPKDLFDLQSALFRRLNRLPKSDNPEVDRLMTECAAQALNLAEPRYSMAKGIITDKTAGHVTLNHSVTLESPLFSTLVEKNDPCILYLLTLGKVLSETIRQMGQDDPGMAYFLDTAASALTEYAAALIQASLMDELSPQRLILTPRFSPGNCDLPMTAQSSILSLLEPDKIGVTLTDTCLMMPEKSLSIIHGIIPEARAATLPKPLGCAACTQQSVCTFRQIRHP